MIDPAAVGCGDNTPKIKQNKKKLKKKKGKNTEKSKKNEKSFFFNLRSMERIPI